MQDIFAELTRLRNLGRWSTVTVQSRDSSMAPSTRRRQSYWMVTGMLSLY